MNMSKEPEGLQAKTRMYTLKTKNTIIREINMKTDKWKRFMFADRRNGS